MFVRLSPRSGNMKCPDRPAVDLSCEIVSQSGRCAQEPVSSARSTAWYTGAYGEREMGSSSGKMRAPQLQSTNINKPVTTHAISRNDGTEGTDVAKPTNPETVPDSETLAGHHATREPHGRPARIDGTGVADFGSQSGAEPVASVVPDVTVFAHGRAHTISVWWWDVVPSPSQPSSDATRSGPDGDGAAANHAVYSIDCGRVTEPFGNVVHIGSAQIGSASPRPGKCRPRPLRPVVTSVRPWPFESQTLSDPWNGDRVPAGDVLELLSQLNANTAYVVQLQRQCAHGPELSVIRQLRVRTCSEHPEVRSNVSLRRRAPQYRTPAGSSSHPPLLTPGWYITAGRV
jgi:hypothetical protein